MPDTVQVTPTVVMLAQAILAVLGPIIMAILVNRNARRKQKDDYERQDHVAEVAARAVQAQLDRQEEASRLLRVQNEKIDAATHAQEENSHRQEAKMDQIHVLVNSNLTASMERELKALRSNLVLLQAAAGLSPSEDAIGLIAATTKEIAELEAQLRDRKIQTDAAATQLATDLSAPPPPRHVGRSREGIP